MTILSVNKKAFEKKFGKLTKELEEKITQMGTPIEQVSDEEISVEIFPNRPDLLAERNFLLAFSQFLGRRGPYSFKLNPAEKNYFVEIKKSVKKVRPHTVCMIVRGLNFSEEKIKEVIDVQEKLHGSIGRKRKKLAIGVYPLEKISLPIRFVGKSPKEISFTPLESERELSARKILKEHPTGIEYAHLLEGKEVYPLFIDAKDEVLSMPPIINSAKTGKVGLSTRDVFVECSGENLFYLKKCLNILALVFSEMGGRIYQMRIKDSSGKSFLSPELSPEKMDFRLEDIEKTLGLPLSEKDARRHLAKMGIGLLKSKKGFSAAVPPYRLDILHWVDLAEEIAIAYGYENFEAEIPKISTIAEEDFVERKKKAMAEILAGLGILEVSSFHLTTKKNIRKMHFDFNGFLEVEDSKTERNVLRIDLLSGILQTFSENSDAAYPQKVFEIGRVFCSDGAGRTETGVVEEEWLSVAFADENARFTDMKQVADYFFKMLGEKYELKPSENGNFIPGRVGEIFFRGKSIGFIGELAPRVLRNWKVKMPVVAMEISIEDLVKVVA